jgi:hypothetical protein
MTDTRCSPVTDDFHPGKCLPDCMMPDGGECCPGYVKLYDAYWHLLKEITRLRTENSELANRVVAQSGMDKVKRGLEEYQHLGNAQTSSREDVAGLILFAIVDEWENGSCDQETYELAKQLSRRVADRIGAPAQCPRCADLEEQLAKADALIATHANSIDNSHPSTWPKGSILAASINRHGIRCSEPLQQQGDK